jgi:hypothetical protein
VSAPFFPEVELSVGWVCRPPGDLGTAIVVREWKKMNEGSRGDLNGGNRPVLTGATSC